MSSMSAALGDAGAKLPFAHGGKTYQVGYITQRVKAGFEQWLKAGVLATLPDLRKALPPADYDREKFALLAEIGSGRLSFHGEAAQRAIQTPDGLLTLLTLLFDAPRGEMAALVMERAEDVKDLLALVVAESLPKESAKNA